MSAEPTAYGRGAWIRAESAAGCCDEALRHEVESLLAHEGTAEGIPATSALEVAAHVLAQDTVPAWIGRYRILRRAMRGLDPVQRLKARENAAGSENPTR